MNAPGPLPDTLIESARPAVRISNLTVSHRRHPAVHHLSGTIHEGSLLAIVGPNGAGKSSLLEAIAGHLPASTGTIQFGPECAQRMAYLPQQSHIDRTFPLSVHDLVHLGHWQASGAFGRIRPAMRQRSDEALAAVGLGGFGSRLISELSVGQFQRVLFARVLLQDARLILLDEPFNAIDARTSADLLHIIQHWHAEGRTVVTVLHDLELVRRHFPHTLLLAREPIAWGATRQVLQADHLFRARQVAEGWNDHAPFCDRPPPADPNRVPAP